MTVENYLGHSPNGVGLANAAILCGLFDYLVSRGMISPTEIIGILDTAYLQLADKETTLPVADARLIVKNLKWAFQEARP